MGGCYEESEHDFGDAGLFISERIGRASWRHSKSQEKSFATHKSQATENKASKKPASIWKRQNIANDVFMEKSNIEAEWQKHVKDSTMKQPVSVAKGQKTEKVAFMGNPNVDVKWQKTEDDALIVKPNNYTERLKGLAALIDSSKKESDVPKRLEALKSALMEQQTTRTWWLRLWWL
jgi:hypothetical protein